MRIDRDIPEGLNHDDVRTAEECQEEPDSATTTTETSSVPLDSSLESSRSNSPNSHESTTSGIVSGVSGFSGSCDEEKRSDDGEPSDVESVVTGVWSFSESDKESVSSGGNASVLLGSDFEDEELQASEEGELETSEENDKEDEGVEVEKVIMYQNRDILDLGESLRNWQLFTPATVPKVRNYWDGPGSKYWEGRSIYHRLGPYGTLDEFGFHKCSNCGFLTPYQLPTKIFP